MSGGIKNKRLLFVIFIVFLFLIILIINLAGKNYDNVPTVGSEKQADLITLDDKDGTFYKSVTYSDYQSVIYTLSDYVQAQGKSPAGVIVKVYDIKTPEREGSEISFKIDILDLDQKKLTVSYDYLQEPDVILNIKEKNYSHPLYGYGEM